MTTQVTQCPKCNTSFRVTEAQLNIANGAVRCGSCLHIFNASEHWLSTELAPRPRTETIESPPTYIAHANQSEYTQATETPAEIHTDNSDFDNIFNNEFISEDFDFDFAEDQPSAPRHAEDIHADQTDSSRTDERRYDNQQLSNEITKLDDQPIAELTFHNSGTELDNNEERYNDDDILIDADELISDTSTRSIINTDDNLYAPDNINDDDDALYSETFRNLDQDELRASAIFKDLDDMGEDHKDEDWTKKLLEDDEPETESTVYQQAGQTELEADEPPDQFSNLFDDLENEPEPRLDPDLLNILNHDDDGEDIDALMDEFVLGDEPMLAGERIGMHHRQLLANIEPEPVFMATANQRNQWVKRGWVTAIVIAILLLAGQYTYFNFERLARDKSYRPILSSLCPLVGCTVPSLHNTQLIRSSNLMVRSHPKIRDALVVDAIITNRAEFAQRFPILELQFTDLEGKVVAGRHFQPDEYLAGELSGSQTMPIKQPVHIALEIVDPGQQAVNYQLYFHPQRDS